MFKEYSISERPLKVQNISQQEPFIQLLIYFIIFPLWQEPSCSCSWYFFYLEKKSLSFQPSKIVFPATEQKIMESKLDFVIWKFQTEYVGATMILSFYLENWTKIRNGKFIDVLNQQTVSNNGIKYLGWVILI